MMKKEENKKGLFGNLFGSNKKKSGCCNIELEEISEEQEDGENKDEKESKGKALEKEDPSCCI